MIDVEKALEHYVKVPEIPIFMRRSGKKKKFLPKWDLGMGEITGKYFHQRFIEKYGRPKILYEYFLETDLYDATFYGLEMKDEPIVHRELFCCVQGIYVENKENVAFLHNNTVVFVNLKKNIVDLEVSRERIKENSKYFTFLHSLFQSFFEEIRRDFESKRASSQRNGLEEFLGFVEFLGSRIASFPDSSVKKDFILNLKVPLISRKGLDIVSVNSIPSCVSGQVTILLLNLESCQECLEQFKLVQFLVEDFVEENEAIVVCFVPDFITHKELKQTISQFFDRSRTGHEYDLLRSYAIKHAEKVCTSIDQILPQRCHFAKMPKQLRSSLIEVSKISGREMKGLREITTSSLYTFRDMPFLLDTLLKCTVLVGPNERDKMFRKEIPLGEYWIDVDDPIIEKLVQNAELVLNTSPLLEAAKIYIRTIPSVSLLPPYFNPAYVLHVATERTITSSLGNVDVQGYDKRKRESAARFLS